MTGLEGKAEGQDIFIREGKQMYIWLSENLGTILTSLVLIAIVTGSILTMIRDKKQGKSCCGGNCAHCHMCTAYDSTQKDKKSQ